MNPRFSALAICLACLAIAGGVAPAHASSAAAAQPLPTVTVQFPSFTSDATTATLSFRPNRIQIAGLSATAMTQLLRLESAGKVTPKVTIKLGSTSTFTLLAVIVTSLQAPAAGGAPSPTAVFAYGSIRST